MDSTYPVARQEHRCFACLNPIPVGLKYEVHTMLDGRDFHRTKLHPVCSEKLREMDIYEFDEGVLRNEG